MLYRVHHISGTCMTSCPMPRESAEVFASNMMQARDKYRLIPCETVTVSEARYAANAIQGKRNRKADTAARIFARHYGLPAVALLMADDSIVTVTA